MLCHWLIDAGALLQKIPKCKEDKHTNIWSKVHKCLQVQRTMIIGVKCPYPESFTDIGTNRTKGSDFTPSFKNKGIRHRPGTFPPAVIQEIHGSKALVHI